MYWDYNIDWGLFRGTKRSGRKILRDEIAYSPVFYYFAMFENTCLRFWWLLAFFTFKDKVAKDGVEAAKSSLANNLQIWAFLGMMAEAVRRSVWTLIRVENEFYNNLEQYRDVISIPPIKDDGDDDNNNNK